jgi:hypothetical protein
MAVVLVAPRPAEAANRRSFFFGGEAAQTGAGLIARVRGTDALFYNPAGLAGQTRSRLDLSMTAVNLRLQSVGDGLRVELPDGVASADLTATEVQPIPSALVFGRRVSETVGVAYGIFVSQSLDNRLDARIERDQVAIPTGGAADVRAGLNSQELSKTYLIGGGVGWQVLPNLRLGSALFVFFDRATTSLQVFSSVDPGAGDPSFFLSSESADVKTLGLAPTVSVQWEATPDLDFGAIVRVPAFSVYGWGDRSPLAASVTSEGQTFSADREPIDEWGVDPLTPLAVELMGAWTVGSTELGATLELVAPIEGEGVRPVDTNFQWNLRLGFLYHLNESLSVGAGLYTDRDVEREDQGDVSLGVDYYGITGGLSLRRALGAAEELLFSSTLAFGYAAGVGTIPGVTLDPINDLGAVTSTPIDVLFHELTLNLASGLEF